MEYLNGIVMDRNGRHVILMTPKGEFKRVRVMDRSPEIGEELSIPVVHRRFISVPKASWIGVAAAALLLITVSPLLKVINPQPDKSVTPGVAVTEKQNNMDNVEGAVPFDSGSFSVAESQQPNKLSSPAATDKQAAAAETDKVTIAQDNAAGASDAPADTDKIIADEVQSAGQPEFGLTGLKKERSYIDPVKSTSSDTKSSTSTGAENGSTQPAVVSAPTGEAPTDPDQTATYDDTTSNYMGPEAPGDRETDSGLNSHLQKPSF